MPLKNEKVWRESWECGIGEYKYFNHVFKKYIGCSVREYQSTLK